MKKCFYALTAALLALTSCSSQEEPVMGAEDGEVTTVTLSLALPSQPQSRVTVDTEYGKAQAIDQVEYAVYDIDGNLVYSSDSEDSEMQAKVDTDDYGHYTLEVTLLTHHTYTVYCWASAKGAPYKFNIPENMNTGVTVSVDYSEGIPANNEKCDAFFGKRTFSVLETQNDDKDYMITLYRPFAQVNILCSDKELAKEIYKSKGKDGKEIGISSIEVAIVNGKGAGAYSNLNFDTYIASEIAENVVYKAQFEKGWKSLVHAGSADVAEYHYLATCYLMTGVSVDTSEAKYALGGYGTQQETTDLKITITYDNGEKTIVTRENVPVRRSWRTNIYGDILTSQANINYRINYGWGPNINNGTIEVTDEGGSNEKPGTEGENEIELS